MNLAIPVRVKLDRMTIFPQPSKSIDTVTVRTLGSGEPYLTARGMGAGLSGSRRCVLWQGTSLSQCLTPLTLKYKWVPANCSAGLTRCCA